MSRIDNDETKGLARPFLILAHVRTGGTFCAHALSNHPQVFCDRGESVHHLSDWRKAGLKARAICRLLWSQTGYLASGFRMIYTQAFHERIWPLVLEVRPHIIHLERRNLARQALSTAYQQAVRAGVLEYHPVHTFVEERPPAQAMDPEWALTWIRRIYAQQQVAVDRLGAYPGEVLAVCYERMVEDNPGSASRMNPLVAAEICRFLRVEGCIDLRVDLKRDHPVATREMFANWREIEAALRGDGWGEAVEYDLAYWERIQ